MTPKESLAKALRLTEEARESLAEEIAVLFPTWSREEVLAERNRRWLRLACEGEPCDQPTSVIYEMLSYRETGDEKSFDRAAKTVASNSSSFQEHLGRVAEQLGVTDEWQSIFDRLNRAP